MELIFLIIGLIAGIVSAYLYFINRLTAQKTNNSEGMFDLQQENVKLIERLSILANDAEKSKNEISEEREKMGIANQRLARAEEAFKNMNEKLGTQKAEMEQLQEKFSTQFENIANKILDEKSKKFTDQNKVNIDQIITPLRERIKDFEEKVDKAYKTESDERITLKAEIKNLVELNKQISLEANNLARAMKGDNKFQGNWGEIILEKILERSGLIKDQEYKTQVNSSDEMGKRILPDVVIYLPDEKHIIIDSKVSLVAYEAYVNSSSEENSIVFIKNHIESIKSHIRNLSEKNYQNSTSFNSPDFVLLFVPIESSFGVAIQADQELFNYAWERKVVIVSPSTLLATLRTIASVWKQERQNKNALEIARQGGALFNKFVSFLEDLEKIDKGIKATATAYDNAKKKLEGHGSLISRAENIRKLGAKATKTIPETFLTADDTELVQE
ncbi:MAG: DNA recombination protein RmuC [Bacteroidota bacterium]|nr:DNA recombination protein RmuC [Bacteroidota bacterium]